jgi:hypothetical protein
VKVAGLLACLAPTFTASFFWSVMVGNGPKTGGCGCGLRRPALYGRVERARRHVAALGARCALML